MPSIKLETSAKLDSRQERELALEISKLAAALLNKPETVFQVRVQSGLAIAFGGTVDERSAFLVISLIGTIAPEVRKTLPEQFGTLLFRYGVDPQRIFLRYQESDVSTWGWN